MMMNNTNTSEHGMEKFVVSTMTTNIQGGP